MSGGLYIADFLILALWVTRLYPFINPRWIQLYIITVPPLLPICILPAVCTSRDYCSAKVRLRSASFKAGPTVAVDKIFLAGQEYFLHASLAAVSLAYLDLP